MPNSLRFYYDCAYIEVYCHINLEGSLERYIGALEEFEINKAKGYAPLVEFEKTYGRIKDAYGKIAFQLALADIGTLDVNTNN